jgi:hypothetical protein
VASDRERIIKLMLLASNPVMRQIGRRVEELFLRAIYGGEFPKVLLSNSRVTEAPDWREEYLEENSNSKAAIKPPEKNKILNLNKNEINRKKLKVLPNQVDVAIVGAGPSGIVLAHHLYQMGKSVVLFDKGPLSNMNHVEYSYDKKILGQIKGPQIDQSQVNGVYPQVFGGGAWAGGTFALDWKQLTLNQIPFPWPWIIQHKTLEGEIVSEENIDAHGLWAQQQFPLMLFGRTEVNNIEATLKEGAAKMKYQVAIPPAFRYQKGQGPLSQSDKMTVVESLLRDLVETDGDSNEKKFFPIEQANVERISWQPSGRMNTATGLEFKLAEESGTRYLRAKKIIISAGAIGTPDLLARSSLPGIDTDKLGKNFGAWPEVRLMAIMKKPLSQNVFKPWSRKTPSMRVELPNAHSPHPLLLEWRPLSVIDVALLGGGDKIQKFQRVLQFSKLGTFVVQTYDPPASDRHILLGQSAWIYRPQAETLKTLEHGLRQATELLLETEATEVIWDIHIPLLGTTMNEYNVIKKISDIKKIPENFLTQALWAPIYTQVISGTVPREFMEDNQRVKGMRNLYIADASLAAYALSPDMVAPLMLMAKKLAISLEK